MRGPGLLCLPGDVVRLILAGRALLAKQEKEGDGGA
jgi:hypothetical protein